MNIPQVLPESWILITCTVSVAATLFLKGDLLRYFYLAQKIPGPSFWELLTVHAKYLLNDNFQGHLSKLSVEYNYKPYGFWRGLKLFVVVSDPETIGEILKGKNTQGKCPEFYDVLENYVGKSSLTASDPQKGRCFRNTTSRLFSKQLFESYVDIINLEARYLIEKLRAKAEDGTDFNVREFLEMAVMRAAYQSFMPANVSIEDENAKMYCWALAKVTQRIQKQTLNPVHYNLIKKFQKEHRIEEQKVLFIINNEKEILRQEIKLLGRQSKQQDNSAEHPLRMSVVNNMKKGGSLTDEELASETMIVVVAATETTSTALAFTILLVALFQDVQKRLVDEIESIFGQSDRSVTIEDLGRLEYMERVIKESLRIFPVAPSYMRNVDEETDLNGMIAPKNSRLVLNILAMHRNPNIYENPLKFDPDRFLPEACAERHPYAFLPFSSGARNCVGQVYAMMSMKVFLSTVLRSYRILPGSGARNIADIETKVYFTLRFEDKFVRLAPLTKKRFHQPT